MIAVPRLVSPAASVLGMILVGLLLAAGCGGSTAGIPEPRDLPEETVQVSVFFSSGRTLVEEPRVVDAGDVYRATLRELLEALPVLNTDIAVVQPEADVRSAILTEGELTIDWSPEVLAFEADDQEKVLALAAILATMGQFPEIETVRFKVDGKSDGTIDGADVIDFWGNVTLRAQPWKVMRVPDPEVGAASEEGGEDQTIEGGTSETAPDSN